MNIKTLLICCSLLVYIPLSAQENEIKATVDQLFDAMRNADSAIAANSFAPNALMQTIAKNKEGATVVRQESVAAFTGFVGKQQKNAADEQITFETIKIDGDMAFVWTPYRFIWNGNFSHSGVNAFCLVRINNEWKIQYIIDTRRK
jgi:ketosteroid isomerase-like protein